MRVVHETTRHIEVATKALDHGGALAASSFTTVKWDIAGKCERPLNLTMTSRSRPKGSKPWQHRMNGASDRFDIDFETRCKKCPPCLRARAAYWRMRATSETANAAGRTWFVTLTLSPESHFQMLLRASLRLAKRGGNWDDLNADEQFAARHGEIGREITLWLKRVRKESGAKLRYLLVAEAHKSGLPHYHLLIHEAGIAPLRARTIQDQWRLGFSQCKLVAQEGGSRSASYVAKYLAKSAVARVRASQGYGSISSPPAPLGHSLPTKGGVKQIMTPHAQATPAMGTVQ